ncbi:uncharacterized protein LOC115301440 isoform X6 [Suricata suricatta]|uniref:uncharacterized protein LOC115301440 isoform X6 n=1 Tax=Suricata suricatta TaxID=37032 RepID=UPI001155AEC7|nr:uncharacterized protein LOC115301440 isoform X6 [Suricata suricatta]
MGTVNGHHPSQSLTLPPAAPSAGPLEAPARRRPGLPERPTRTPQSHLSKMGFYAAFWGQEGRRAPGESGGQGPRLKVGQRARRRAQLVGLRGGNRRLSSPPGPSASSKNVPAPGRPPLKTDVREKADYCQRLEAATRALGSTGRTSCVFQRSLSVRSSPSLSGDASQVTLKQKALQGPQRPEDVPRWT